MVMQKSLFQYLTHEATALTASLQHALMENRQIILVFYNTATVVSKDL